LDPRDTFIRRFGDLVALLRVDPGNDAAQDLALTAAVAAVADHSIVVESGVEHGSGGEDLSLAGRLRARRVDLLRVGAGAPPEDLLRLARALSHDVTPVPSTPQVRVEMLPAVMPGDLVMAGTDAFTPARGESDRRSWRDRRRWSSDPWQGPERRAGTDRRMTGERRLRMRKHHEADIGHLQDRLTGALRARAWRDGLEAAHELFLYAARVPAIERRSFTLGARRFLSPHAFAAFIQLGLRDAAQQGRIVDVLRWSGLEGADAIVEAIRSSRSVGPRKFLHQALIDMPECWSAVAPLLNSPESHEVSLAAGILGQMRRPEALGPLKGQLTHSDAPTRKAVLLALANFPSHDVAEVLGAALSHPSANTRATAAEAIGRVGAAPLAMPLVAALGTERDSAAWRAMIRALGRLASTEACAALAAVALARRRLFGRAGYSMGRRLEAVRALSNVPAPCRDPALARVVREGDPPVRRAAQEALERGPQT
jgi:hypothetical protein